MTNKLLFVLVLVLLSFCLVSTEKLKSESTKAPKNEALDEECRLCPLIYDPGFLF
jgi:hypothetical protein